MKTTRDWEGQDYSVPDPSRPRADLVSKPAVSVTRTKMAKALRSEERSDVHGAFQMKEAVNGGGDGNKEARLAT